MSEYWVSCKQATGYVETDKNNIITITIPIWRCFTKQHFDTLILWLTKKFGTVDIKDLNA